MAPADHVIIGAGAAGCVLARRLIDAGRSVCLIEAGPLRPRHALVDPPGGLTALWGSALDWALPTVPQPGLAGRSITLNQGRIVGGSSAINAMMHVHCNAEDYRNLTLRSGGAWTEQDIANAFARMEDYLDGPAPGRSQGGLLHVRDCPDPAAFSPEFRAAATALGHAGEGFDYNGPEQMNGAGPLQFNIGPDGRRHSAFNAYLQPVLDSPLLTLMPDTTATRLRFDGPRVVAVEVSGPDGTTEIGFTRDVILALGALQTPALLLRSGLGPAEALRAAGLPVVADLPAVGQNLQDHLQLPVIFRLTRDLPNPALLTGNVLFVNLNGHGAPGTPDLQLNHTPAAPAPLMRLLPPLGGPVMIFLPILIQPKSRGSVSLRPDGSIALDPRYLSDPSDVELLTKAVELCRSLARTQPLAGLAGDELAPGATPTADHIRGGTSTLWHPVGTAALGTDPADSVAGPDLAVHGVEGLRICDASLIPRASTGNTHVPTLITAEVGATKLLAA